MIRPQAPKYSRPFQLKLLFWGIVPCVSKIDTLGLFHSLLKEKFAGYNAGRAVGGRREGIWQDAPEYKLIRCIPYDILSNVLETFK
jgi:hypothetical protein